MAKRMFTLGFGIALGMVIHHYVIEKSGMHNPFDDAVDKGAAKLKTSVNEFKESDDVQGLAKEKAAAVADKVSDKADDAAEKISSAAAKAASKVSDVADTAATKTRRTAKKAAGVTQDAAADAKERVYEAE